jgi:hypothetical protein
MPQPMRILALSSTTIADTASIGTVIGNLSVVGGGSYDFTLESSDPLFLIAGSSLEVAAALTAGFYAIAIQASNKMNFITQSFLITVTTSSGAVPSDPIPIIV